MEHSISFLMFKDHKKIDTLLQELENHIKQRTASMFFNKFKWNIERHFFIEEKAIFDLSSKIKGEETEELFNLLSEHVKILALINKIDEELKENPEPDISDVKVMLLSHANFENEVFYPKLDDDLTPEQKSIIIEKIKEMLVD